jgi:hypothetical protein
MPETALDTLLKSCDLRFKEELVKMSVEASAVDTQNVSQQNFSL